MTSPSADEVRGRVGVLMPAAREALSDLVAFRSVANPSHESVEECLRAAEWVVATFADAGMVDIAMHPTEDGSEAVIGTATGPSGTPTVLLYCHYDVQPASGQPGWRSPPWQLTERDGRWYARGAADCKGSIVAQLTALRALSGALPCTVKLLCEGSEEQGTGGLEALVRAHPDLVRADAMLIADSGNIAAGVPTLTTSLRGMTSVIVTVEALASGRHSGMYGGPAPDALFALVGMLATLRDDRGNTTIEGLDSSQRWEGAEYEAARFRRDVAVLPGVELLGEGSIADMLWARPAVTVTGIDAPTAIGSGNEIQPCARARVSLRAPADVSTIEAQDALVSQLGRAAPWNVQVEIERESSGDGFRASTSGTGFDILRGALEDAYDHEVAYAGQGGSIPLCSTLRKLFPRAEIMLLGLDEPDCQIHAANESVDPGEIERLAVAEALFLSRYAQAIQDGS